MRPGTTAFAVAVTVFAAAAVGRWAARCRDRARVVARLIEGGPRRRWRSGVPPIVVRAMEAAALPVVPDVAWAGWWVAVAFAAVMGWLAGGPALAGIAVVSAVLVPIGVLTAQRDRARRLVEAALPALLEAVARSLRSGATVGQALDEASATAPGRLGGDLVAVGTDVAGGRPLSAALDGWADRCPVPGVRLSVAVLSLAATSGGAAAQAVDGVAATLRANLSVAAEVRALSSQARLSGLVIALAPVGFAALAASTDRRTAAFLLRTPTGLACLAGGLVLDGVAAWWMHRITAAPT